MEEGQKEKEKVVDLEQPTNAEGKQENKKQESVEGGNKVICGKRCKNASIIVAIVIIVAAIIIGVVFGLQNSGNLLTKSMSSGRLRHEMVGALGLLDLMQPAPLLRMEARRGMTTQRVQDKA